MVYSNKTLILNNIISSLHYPGIFTLHKDTGIFIMKTIIAFLAVICLVACSEPTQKKILGSWQIDSTKMQTSARGNRYIDDEWPIVKVH